MMTLFERLWRLLPDRCEIPGCRRAGVRGNENRLRTDDGSVLLVCDDCHAWIKRNQCTR